VVNFLRPGGGHFGPAESLFLAFLGVVNLHRPEGGQFDRFFHYFAKQVFELAYRCETDLPTDIHQKVIEFEKSEKLNPPSEKRAKQINLKELEKDNTKIKSEAGTQGIVIQDDVLSTEIDKLPLYKEDSTE